MRLRKSFKFMLHHTPSPIVSFARPQRRILLHQPSTKSARPRPSRELSILTSSPATEKPSENEQSSQILHELEIVSTSYVEQSPKIGPGMSFSSHYNNHPVCKRHKPTINRHDINRAIEVARRTSPAFTDHVPESDFWTWLGGMDCLEELEADDGSCTECFLIRHLRSTVGFPLVVSTMHTGDTEMLNEFRRVYESIGSNSAEYVMLWASKVISAAKGKGT